MTRKIKAYFLAMVLVQGLHSIEEYQGKLWESFPPARALTNLVSDNLVTGFLVINIGLFVFGLWSWGFPVMKNYSYARPVLWFWVVLQMINGIGHPIWSIAQKSYTPGMYTAPVLLVLALVLMKNLIRSFRAN